MGYERHQYRPASAAICRGLDVASPTISTKLSQSDGSDDVLCKDTNDAGDTQVRHEQRQYHV